MHRLQIAFTHTAHKLREGFFFILLFLFFLIGFFTSQYFANDDLKKVNVELTQSQTQLKKILTSPKKPTAQDLQIVQQKDAVVQSVVTSALTFSAKVNSLPNGNKEVVVTMQGGLKMKADAADLALSYSDNLSILEILPGKTFPSYPRKVSENGSILVSGVTTIGSQDITFGSPNTVFITFVVEKTGDPAQKGVLILDAENTKIFFQGESLFDLNATFKQIEL